MNSAFKIGHLFTIEPYTDTGPFVALIKSILFIIIGYLLTSNKSNEMFKHIDVPCHAFK